MPPLVGRTIIGYISHTRSRGDGHRSWLPHRSGARWQRHV